MDLPWMSGYCKYTIHTVMSMEFKLRYFIHVTLGIFIGYVHGMYGALCRVHTVHCIMVRCTVQIGFFVSVTYYVNIFYNVEYVDIWCCKCFWYYICEVTLYGFVCRNLVVLCLQNYQIPVQMLKRYMHILKSVVDQLWITKIVLCAKYGFVHRNLVVLCLQNYQIPVQMLRDICTFGNVWYISYGLQILYCEVNMVLCTEIWQSCVCRITKFLWKC